MPKRLKHQKKIIVPVAAITLAILTIVGYLFTHHPKQQSSLNATQQAADKGHEVATQPDATQPAAEQPQTTPKATQEPTKPAATTTTTTPQQPTNPYQYGYASWWVFKRRTEVSKPVGTTWVNEQSWPYYAKNDGYVVDKVPQQYDIFSRNKALGFIESVNADGSLTATAMNYSSGFGHTDTFQINPSEFDAYLFIH